MNIDMRLKLGFLDHPKIIKLKRRCGADAVLSLLRLWCYAAENKPGGILSGMDEEDIEIASCWEHTESMLPVCTELKLITKKGGNYIIHDWKDHNPWAANAESRSETARLAATTRWEKDKEKRKVKSYAFSMQCAYDEHALSNAPFLSFPYLTLPKEYAHSKEFAECWVSWEKYRHEMKKTLKQSTVEKQIKSLSKYPVGVSIKAIDKSIESGWTGIFPEKIEDKKPAQPNDQQWMPLTGGM